MLVSSELSAARDRISRLRAHLERSEKVHSLEKEKLKDSVGHVRVMCKSCEGHVTVLCKSCEGHVTVLCKTCEGHVREWCGHERVQ